MIRENTMRRIVLTALLVLPSAAWAADPDPAALVEKSYDVTKLDAAESISTLTIRNAKGDTRVRKLAMVLKRFDGGKTEKRLIRFVAPADVKGTGLLTYDYEEKTDDMWLFLPALRKTRRIVSSDKAKSFMGSEFSYADVTPPSLADFTYSLKGSETVGKVACWVVEAKPKTEDIAEDNGYSKRTLWIGKPHNALRKATYHDLSGELLKELSVGEVREVDPAKKRFRFIDMEMVNKINGRSSSMHVDSIQLRDDVPDDYFTSRYLERQ